MEAKYKFYDWTAGAGRIRSILDQTDSDYQERDSLPSRDSLTFKNGYYANCSAVFVDIRSSSELPNKHTRPVLARLYRAFISEMTAVLAGVESCVEVSIVGDCVWAVYDTKIKADIDKVFTRACYANSMIGVLNAELARHDMTTIEVGIGMEEGRALVVKAGYEGSGMNDIIYMGDVVNKAAKLASNGNKTWADSTMMVGRTFYSNLSDDNSQYLRWSSARECWQGGVVMTHVEDWRKATYGA